MKCDKHGIEMEWRGSLMKGGMYCVCCDAGAPAVAKGTAIHEAFAEAIASGTGVMGIDPGDLQGSFSPDPVKHKIAVAGGRQQRKSKLADLAKQYGGIAAAPVKAPQRANSVGYAASRVVASDRMRADLLRGAPKSYCPYCDDTVGPEHLQARPGTQADLCRNEYDADLAIIKRGP